MTHSEKIKAAKRHLAGAQGLLQEMGVLVTIHRSGKGVYQVINNFEIAKEYKTRRSARHYVLRMADQIMEGLMS